MIGTLLIARIAALIGDPARCSMLLALKYDEFVSAGELADLAGIARSTAREHLLKMMDSGLVIEKPLGRQKYYGLADTTIAEILDGIEGLASQVSKNQAAPVTHDKAMLHARCCGDHLSGQVGARIAERFLLDAYVTQTADGTALTPSGRALLDRLDVDAEALSCRPRRLLYLCPDWTEDSFHLGGAVGAALLKSFVARDWMRIDRKERSVAITPKGYGGLRSELGLDLHPPA